MSEVMIKIFIASSVDEFKTERYQLSDFIYHLSDRLEEMGVRVRPVICEDMSQVTRNEAEQERIDQELLSSQYCYVLLGREAGKYTVAEYDKAIEQYRQTGAPLVVVRIKKQPDGTEDSESIKNFIQHRYETHGHYSNRFEHIDSIKLVIVQELLNSGLLKNAKFSIIDGMAKINETDIDISIDNIPAYANNGSLKRLKRKLAQLSDEYQELCEEIAANPSNASLLQEKKDNEQARAEILEQIHQVETSVLSLLSKINTSDKDAAVSERIARANELLERGDYVGAGHILNDPLREKELDHYKEMAQVAFDGIKNYISENLLEISRLNALGINNESALAIESVYDKTLELIFQYHFEKEYIDDLLAYLSFLDVQQKYDKLIDIANSLLKEFERQKDQKAIAQVCNSLGNAYKDKKSFALANQYYQKSLSYYKQRISENNEEHCINLAMEYNNFGLNLEAEGEMEKADKCYRESLSLCSHIKKKYGYEDAAFMGTLYNNHGITLHKLGQSKQAEESFKTALSIRRKLASSDHEQYDVFLATTCHNLASLLTELKRYSQAESLFKEALRIRKSLAEKNHDAYDHYLATTLQGQALVYSATGKSEKAIEALRNALMIRERLFSQNPSTYMPYVAKTSHNLGSLLLDRDKQSALPYLEKAYSLRKQLCTEWPSTYWKDTYITVLLYVQCLALNDMGSKAIQVLLDSKELAKVANNTQDNTDLITLNINLARKLITENNNSSLAAECLFEALSIEMYIIKNKIKNLKSDVKIGIAGETAMVLEMLLSLNIPQYNRTVLLEHMYTIYSFVQSVGFYVCVYETAYLNEQLGFALLDSKKDEAVSHFMQAIEYYEKHSKLATANKQSSGLQSYSSFPPRTIAHPERIAKCASLLSEYYTSTNDKSEAVKYKLLANSNETFNETLAPELASCHEAFNETQVYFAKHHDAKKAYEQYWGIIKRTEKCPDCDVKTYLLAMCHFKIASMYAAKAILGDAGKEYEIARGYSCKISLPYKYIAFEFCRIMIAYNYALYLDLKHQYAKAERLYIDSIDNNHQLNKEEVILYSYAFGNYGAMLTDSGRLQEAINMYKKSMPYVREMIFVDPDTMTQILARHAINLGSLLLHIGFRSEAKMYLKEARDAARKQSSLPEMKQLYNKAVQMLQQC